MQLKIALGDYAHCRAIASGTQITASGTELETGGQRFTVERVVDKPSRIFRAARETPPPYDVQEMSLATTYVLADQGETAFRPIPVFPSRMFRHSAFYVRDAALRPEALRGKRIGVVRYGMTAAVWARALLQTGYGLTPQDLRWWVGEQQFFAPEGLELHPVEGLPALEAMLLAGELDVLFSVDTPQAFHDGHLHRLFPDVHAAEREDFARTGIYPIMHCLLLRRELDVAHPGLAAAMLRACEDAKAQALHWLLDTDASSLPLPFQHGWAEQVRGLLGADPWPYGVAANRAVLTAFGQHLHAQGLTSRALPPEAVFPPLAP